MSWTPAKVSAMAHLNNATHELLVYAVPAMIKLSPTDKAAVEALVGKVHTHLQGALHGGCAVRRWWARGRQGGWWQAPAHVLHAVAWPCRVGVEQVRPVCLRWACSCLLAGRAS